MEAKREVGAEIKGRWSADKGKRIDTLQQELDDLEELIVNGDLTPAMRLQCTDRKIRLLHEIAEQVGELPKRVKVEPPPEPYHHIIKGDDGEIISHIEVTPDGSTVIHKSLTPPPATS